MNSTRPPLGASCRNHFALGQKSAKTRNVLAVNGFGWGPASPPVKFKTLRSEVEVTGVQTQDERDEEAKKRAVDVDAADEPEAKRAK